VVNIDSIKNQHIKEAIRRRAEPYKDPETSLLIRLLKHRMVAAAFYPRPLWYVFQILKVMNIAISLPVMNLSR